MRNSNRINRVLNLIKEIWDKNPDLRLFQLLGNPLSAEDHYYLEDDILENTLKKYYKKTEEKNDNQNNKLF